MQTQADQNIEARLKEFEASPATTNRAAAKLKEKIKISTAQAAPTLEKLRRYAPKDFLVNGISQLQINHDKNRILATIDGEDDRETFPVHNHALAQLGQAAGIPGQYVTMLRDKDPALLAYNLSRRFNTMEEKNGTNYLCRVANGELMGWLSDRFDVHDTFQFVEMFLGAAKAKDLVPTGIEHHETRIIIRMLSRSVYEIHDKEAIVPGVLLQTGDFGGVAIKVVEFWMRPWCLNGACTDYGFRKVHLGRKLDTTTFTAETVKKQTDFLISAMKDTIDNALSPRNLVGRLEGLRKAHEAQIPVEKTLEAMASRSRITKEEKKRIMELLQIDNPDLLPPVRIMPDVGCTSMARLANAFSLFAQDVEIDGIRSAELQEIAGELLFPPEEKKAA